MNKNVNSPKDINEYKIVVPMSNEAVNKIKSNITKSILGVSIAGVMIAGAATQVKAETVENPTAIVQEAKEEVRTQYDQEIASILKSNSSTEDEEVAELKSATVNLADETSEESESASEEEAITEDKGDISLKDFIADDSLNKFFDFDKIEKEEEKLEISEENPAEVQKAEAGEQKEDKNLQKADDLNYANDEKNVGDYRQSDLQPGNVNQELLSSDEKQVKDGFKFEFENPSEDSPSKTEYGYQITIDKKTGQRTYTKITVTDGGRVPAPTGEKPMMGQGEKLTTESPDVTYQPTENSTMDSAGVQRNLNYVASEDTLKHINNKDNPSTSFGMKDDYTTENPRVKFFGDNFSLGYKVNPWPNENDSLKLMKLNGEYKEKVFVQGQDINTGIKVDNIDDNAKERLVGQVYNPNTGEVVPGASAYIGNDGNIHIKMPEGALKKDENGKTVINEDSIFNTPDYKALQNLDVKFFARPRTAEEFKNIAETPDDFGETGTYTGSGAGTGVVNHKGTDVTIDKQGIDRYDHYNLIGKFKLNLDDTRYYNQSFEDGNGDDTSKNTSSNIRPNEPFKVKMFTPKDPSKTDKSAEEMNAADDRGEANGRLIMDFINKANEGKSEDDKWKIEASPNNISEFSITAPESAKAGDFIAIPVEYTYTNGSKDIHWFHFVVQESDNNIPTYESEAGIADKKLTQKPDLSKTEKDLKKLQPKSYKLVKTEYKDDKGNTWKVSIDETTGVVTATVPDNENIPDDGAKLKVDVKVTYEEEVEINGQKETRTYTEKTQAEFYSIPENRQEVKKKFESELPYKTTFKYDDTILAGKVVEEGGVVGKQNLVFSQIVVGNKKGIVDENGKFVEGKEALTTEVVTQAVDKIIKIGTKPATTTVEIPFDTEYELDYTKKKGEKPIEITSGQKGEVTVKTTRNPETGEITVTQEVTKNATNRKLSIPAGTEGSHEYTEEKPFTYEVEFDPNFYTNFPDAKDNYKIVTEGKVGEKTTKWTIKNSEIVGEAEIIRDTVPTNAVIKVGQKDYTGTITHKESHEVPFEVEYKYSDELEAGQTKVEQKGEKGSYDVEYSQKIKNGEKDGEATSKKTNEIEAKKEIIVIGTKPLTKTVEKPFNTEYQYDENLDAGKTEEVTPGKNGKVTITTTYDKDQKKVVTSETEEAGQNRVVKIGGKTTGEVKVKSEIPFEVEIIEDDTMDAGTHKIEQEGENGEKETTIVIENSVEKSKTDKKTKEAKKKIIRVGTKPNDDMCPAPNPDKQNPDKQNPDTPNGGGDSENPDEDKPDKPDTPDTPGKPDEPGDTHEEPGTPGETPDQPGTPGEETPSDPGTPGSEEPGENIENPDTPDTIENPEVEEVVDETLDNPSETPEKTEEVSSDAKTLPKTGGSLNASLYGYLMGVLGSGFLGLGALKKKKEDEEEEN